MATTTLTPEQQQRLQQLSASINFADPNFQQQYTGRSIYWGDDVFKYQNGAFNYVGNIQDIWKNEGTLDNASSYDPTGGLQPINWKSGWTQTDAFKYINQQTPEYQQAASTNFSQGTKPTADQYTGKLGGYTTGGVQLYQLKDGTMTATPPPSGAMTGGGVATGYEASQAQSRNNPGTDLVAPPVEAGVQAAAVDNVTEAVVNGNIPFKQGLNPAQQQSIQNLLMNRPDSGMWTPTDIANWNYATNNAPLPGGSVQGQGNVGLTPQQLQGLDAAAQREAQGIANETDLKNLEYARENFGYQPGQAEEQQDQVDKLMKDNNITVNPDQEPKTQFKSVYQQSLLDSGAIDAKAQAEGYAQQLRELNDKKTDEIQEVNDNPWLTEGIRQRRIASIEQRYEGKTANLTGQFNLAQGLYETAVSQAQFIASQSMLQNRWQQEMDQNLQFKLMDMAIKEMEAAKDNLSYGVVGQYVDPTTFQVVNQYGWIDKGTGMVFGNPTTNPNPGLLPGQQSGNYGITTDASGASYDFGNYAEDPSYVTSLQKDYIDKIGKMNSWEQMDSYIKSEVPDSPITGEMIARASSKYGVSWESLMAVIQKESVFGTSNVAKQNNNVGGISNVGTRGTARPAAEGGYYTKFATLQDGIDAVAQNLAGRATTATATTSTTQPTVTNPQVVQLGTAIQAGQMDLDTVLKTLPKGMQFELSKWMAENPSKQVNEIRQMALDNAYKLKNWFDEGNRAAVGGSAYFVPSIGNLNLAPFGTETRDFIVALNNLKAQLSLDNAKLLKGQGQISDGERRILELASSGALDRTQSEEQWYSNLNDIISALEGNELRSQLNAMAGGTTMQQGGGSDNDPLNILNQ